MTERQRMVTEAFFQFHKLTFTSLIPEVSHGDGVLLMKLHSLKERNMSDVTISAVAKFMNVSPPSISRTIKHLEQKGYLKRYPSKEDRRVIYVKLTPQGETLVSEIKTKLDTFYESVLNRMDEKKLQNMLEGMQELYEIAQDEIEKSKKERRIEKE